jgi:hypothetical protein
MAIHDPALARYFQQRAAKHDRDVALAARVDKLRRSQAGGVAGIGHVSTPVTHATTTSVGRSGIEIFPDPLRRPSVQDHLVELERQIGRRRR